MVELKGKYTDAKIFTDLVDDTAMGQVVQMINHKVFEGTKVRFMPDIHAGKGATIGTTIQLPEDFANWKVSPNVVGVDVGCFSGDTKVKLTDGRSLSFLELIEEEKAGKVNYTFGVKEGAIGMAKIAKPRKTRTVNEMAYVTLDNGEVIKCTTDHKFILSDSSEVMAKDLLTNMSLMPIYIEKAEDVKSVLRDYKLEKLTKGMGGHHAVYNPLYSEYVMAHVLADEYNLKKSPSLGDKTYDGGRRSFVRHHRDFNKHNNDPSNIQRVGFKEHWEIHADSINETNKMGLTGFSKVIELDPTLPSRAGKLRAKATWEGPNREKNLKDKSDLWKKMNKEGVLNSKEQRERSRQRQLTNNTSTLPEQMKDPKFVLGQRISKYARIAQKTIEIYGELNEDTWEKTRVTIAKNSPKYSSLPQLLIDSNMTIDDLLTRKLKKRRNHKVLKVEIKQVEPTDVYCLTNFDQGNFALDAGVFVKNCAIMMYKINDKDIDLERLDDVVNDLVPAGFSVHNKAQDVKFSQHSLDNLTFAVKSEDRIHNSLGTLGGGNHFIELGKDGNDDYWLSVHSGSRGLGVQVAKHHQDVAIDNLSRSSIDVSSVIEKLKSEGRQKEIQSTLAEIKKSQPKLSELNKTLAHLEGEDLKAYLQDMDIAQKFAARSREIMLDIIVKGMGLTVVDKFDSVHNFIEHDKLTNGVIRKGATSAKQGERLVIPLNMRDGSIIAEGKGNPDWNESAPHGAGRTMSRTKARNELSLEDFKEQMSEVHSSSIGESTLDEAPGAYKPAQEIIDNIGDTVDILHIVKPVYNFKAK